MPNHRSEILKKLKQDPAPSPIDNQPPLAENSPHRRGGEMYEFTNEGKIESKERNILAETYKIGDEVIIDYPFHSEGKIPSGTRAKIIGWSDELWRDGDVHLTYYKVADKKPGIFRNCHSIYVTYPGMPEDKEETGAEVDSKNVYLANKEEAKKRIDIWGDKPFRGHIGYKVYRRVGDLPE